MKRSLKLLSILLLVVNTSFAQDLPVDQNTGKITYMEVVDAAGLKAKDIYTVAKKWGTDKKFLVKEDKENETLVYTCTTPVEYPNAGGNANDRGKVTFSLSVFSKDGKYRYILTDLAHTAEGKTAGSDGGKLENVSPDCGKTKMSAKGWVTIKTKTDASLKALIADLKRVIKEAQNDPAKKSDW
ncbi:MAG TPA: DUF4468 domain-containing protein [Cytophagaceae bacterium]|jgi:hypothetical protein|nr:DUF4468 domain-containing protein [Cytophagaceae bacterium]